MRYSKLFHQLVIFLFLFVLCLLLTTADGYNIDVRTVREFRGAPRSGFGWSVAQYKEKGVSWLILGTLYAREEAIYRCDPKTNNSCSAFIHTTGEKPGYQFSGEVVQTSGEDGFILAFSPVHEVNGKQIITCYLISDNFTNIVEFSLCHGDLKICNYGYDASISQNSEYLYIKTKGELSGQMFSIMKDAVYDKQFDYYASQAMMANSTIYVKGIDSDALIPGETVTRDKFFILALVAIRLPIMSKGRFVDGVAIAGIENANKWVVRVYTRELTKLKTLVISYDELRFFRSICVADVDGDGKQDIIVVVKGDRRHSIHVYYQGGHVCNLNDQKCWESTFERRTISEDFLYSEDYGINMVSLGDIDQDGYEDLAVSLPELGLYRRNDSGVVYIYHGSVDGLRSQPSQILRAREMCEITGISSLFFFGRAIAGGLDLDGNGYPDFTVGAIDVVYHFRSKPVVRVMANLTYLSNTKYIDINQTVPRNITLRLCLRYTGVGVHPTSELNTTVTLDALKPNSPRLMFNGQRPQEVFTLTKNHTLCKEYVTILKCIIEDTSTPIVANLNYSLLDSNYTELGQVLDPYFTGKHNDSLFIKNDGVPVNICIPELDLKLTSDIEIYRAGTCDKVTVNVTVENRKDDSFGTKLYLDIPLGLIYVNVDQSTGTKDLIDCHPLKQHALICDLGNPLPAPATVKFRLIFQPVYVDTKMSYYAFVGILNCTNPYSKPTAADNVKTFVLPILPKVTHSPDVGGFFEKIILTFKWIFNLNSECNE